MELAKVGVKMYSWMLDAEKAVDGKELGSALGSSCGVDKYQLEEDDGNFHAYKRSLNKGIASKKELLKLVSKVADRSKPGGGSHFGGLEDFHIQTYINSENCIGVQIAKFIGVLNISSIEKDPGPAKLLCAGINNVAAKLMALVLGHVGPEDHPTSIHDPGNHKFSRMAITKTFNKCKSLPQVSKNSLICFQCTLSKLNLLLAPGITIPGVEDETGGTDECSSGSESDCEEDNLSIHTGPNDENLRGSMLAEQLKAINHQKTKSVAILMETLAIWNGFLKNATETSSTLTELVAQLDENIFEIILCVIPQNQPCYCHDLNKWEASLFPSSSHWRNVLEAVLKNALKLQQDWTLLQLPPADQVLAVALADSTGAKSTIVCHRAISKTDAKSNTFALFLEIIRRFLEASGEIVQCIRFDMEHVSQIAEPIKGEGFSLYRSLVQATRTQIQTEYVKLCHLVDNLTPPSIVACISWLRLTKSYPGPVRMDICDIYLFHNEFTSAVKARKLSWSCLPAHGNRQVSPKMEELIEWCGYQNPLLHKTQWKSQLTNFAQDCGSFFLDLQQVQTGANSEFVSALLVLKGKLKLDSKFITRSPLSTFLADAHFHILETINLAKNRKTLVSRTSLNVELYCPIPHPLKATKKLFINPDYDHLICKNFIRRACDSNFMDMRSGLQCIFDGWFARDPMDVKLGHEAFLPETAEQLRAKGFHDAAKVSKILGDFYDALDCRGISDQEQIASARKVVSWIHEVFGADLRKDPCRGKYSGLPWQVILPLLVAESIGRTTETTVAKLFQHFNWSRVADPGVIQDFLIDESLSSTFVVGLNNANNTYISKGSTSKLGEWNVQIEKEYPVPSFLKEHLLPIPQCLQTPNPSGVVPPLPNILSESSNVVNIPHVRALAIAYSHNVSVSTPPSESQKRKATDANYMICQRIFNCSMLANSGTKVQNPATLTMDFIVPASKDEKFIDMQCYGNHFIKMTTSTKASASTSIHPVSLSFLEGKVENVCMGKKIYEIDQRLEPTATMSEQPEKPSSAIVLQDSYLSFNGSRLVPNGEPVFQEYLFDTQESGYSINLGFGHFYKDGVFKKIKASNHHFRSSSTLLTHKSIQEFVLGTKRVSSRLLSWYLGNLQPGDLTDATHFAKNLLLCLS
ncbi:hypothetical protein BDR26DRAFT_1011380 [Obelidium mucronatum]|nr:hypothetical protein BDR26DRAFT_1011380 [Obelidium mucronatum]